MTFPNHTRLTASLCACLGGFAGLVYSGSFFLTARGGKKNYYELQDWIVYAVVPFAAYGVQVFGGVLFFHAPQRGLTLVAAGMLSLLALAVRNSWVIAVDVVSTPSWAATFDVAHYQRDGYKDTLPRSFAGICKE